MILYDAPRCPFCARVRIVIAEKGLEVETVLVDLDDRPDWVIALNPPEGRVPVLDDGGWVLPESAVICEYLEERFPDPPLLPSDPGLRAAARLVALRFEGSFRPAYYALRRGVEGAEDELARALLPLEELLRRAPWLTGSAFGLADIAYLPWALRARDALGVDLVGLPSVRDWLERACERPSVAAEARIVVSL